MSTALTTSSKNTVLPAVSDDLNGYFSRIANIELLSSNKSKASPGACAKTRTWTLRVSWSCRSCAS